MIDQSYIAARWMTSVALAVSGAVAVGNVAAQQLYSSGYVDLNDGACPFTQVLDGTPISFGCSNSSADGTASGSGHAVATYGHLGASLSTSANATGVGRLTSGSYTAIANGHATAGFQDFVTIYSNGVGGTEPYTGTGSMTLSMYIAAIGPNLTGATAPAAVFGGSQGASSTDVLGLLIIDGNYFSGATANGSIARAATEQPVQYQTDTSSAINGVPVSKAMGFQQFTVPIRFSSPFSLGMELRLNTASSATADFSGNAFGSVNFEAMKSFDWAGIQDVMIDGVSVSFTLSSESGTDWTQSFAPTAPVPEPSTYAMMLLGAAVLVRATTRLRQVPSNTSFN